MIFQFSSRHNTLNTKIHEQQPATDSRIFVLQSTYWCICHVPGKILGLYSKL
jgi:hypothetical protein